MMNALLVNTNRMKPAIAPIGLDYIADGIIDAGHDARLLDLSFTDDIASAFNSFTPDVIGVTLRNTDDCYLSGGAFFVPEAKQIVDRLKEHSDAPIVMGGVGFSVVPGAVMDWVGTDYGIAGAGDETFVQFLAALDRRSGVENVPNLLHREGGAIRRNPPGAPSGEQRPRRREFVDNPRYFREGGQAGIETKHGCDMGCIYCADPVSKGRHVSLRQPSLVVDEIKLLLAQGIDHLHTCDPEFNIPGDHAKNVCRAIIDAGLGDKIRWYTYCSITPFDDEMAGLFKRAGCAGVDFGADSGCDAILHRLGRAFRAEDLVNTSKLCHDHGIPFMYDLLIGGPGETRETARETIELMRRIEADCVGVAMGVRIYDGTAMADFVRSQGDVATNPSLYGAKEENPHFLKPIYYISPDLGKGIVSYLASLVGEDHRFFLPSNEEVDSNYNYNENTVLVQAIQNGARGAYWDILRRMHSS